METEDRKLALLIDSDNVSSKYLNGIFDELSQYGIITYRRIYGDFTSQLNARWSEKLLEKSIIPIQQFSNTSGKNATDSALIIDAMDLLYTSNVDGFCIVSSDSDFTRLASRLRESGKIVIGMGEKKTPRPFIVSCDKFIYIENLGNDDEDTTPQEIATNEEKQPAPPKEKISYAVIKLLRHTIDDLTDDNDWVSMAEVGSLILKKRPDFDPRNYGFQKLTPLIESCSKYFEIEKRKVDNSHVVHVFVRLRRGK